ncbi:MAG: host attachment protein [Rhodospirillales bacterium]|nr:MAG: host attachment protein [Rhodospirillales bacterium]
MPNEDSTTWFVIADGAKARVLARHGGAGPLEPASELCFTEAEARLPSRDVGADRPGRVHESADTARHAMEPRVDWHRFAKQQFAKSVAAALEAAAQAKRFGQLVLVAPPRTLGDLRQALGPHAAARVAGEIAKDLTNLPDHDLPAHLG